MRELDLRHLRVICTIASAGSLSRAAAQLGLSQPALTALLHRIERRAGEPMFVRSPQGVTPTDLGRLVLVQAQVVLTDMENLNESMSRRQRTIVSQDSQTVRVVGYTGPLIVAFSARLSKELGARIELIAENSVLGICQKVIDGVDFGLLAAHEELAAPIPRALEYLTVANEPVCVGIPANHPLAAQDSVSLGDLAAEDWIFCPVPDDDGLNPAFFRACAAAGFAPHITHHAEGSVIFRDLVAAGTLGIFQGVAARGDPRVAFRPLAGDPIRAQIQLVWRPETPNVQRICEALIAAYRDVLADLPEPDRLALEASIGELEGGAPTIQGVATPVGSG